MEYMGPVRFRDVAGADSKILRIILKLGKEEEITVPANLGNIFSIPDIRKNDHDEESAWELNVVF